MNFEQRLSQMVNQSVKQLRRPVGDRRPRIRTLLAVAAIAASSAAVAAPAANAATNRIDATQTMEAPTIRELIEACGVRTDVCTFHPRSRQERLGESKPVGRLVQNCSSSPQQSAIGWWNQTGGSNSAGVSVKAEGGFGEVFKVSVEASYSRTWSWMNTVTQTDTITVPGGQMGQIYHRPLLQTVTGNWEMRFGSRFHDHYIWYVDNFTAETATNSNREVVTFQTRGMSQDERRSCP
jgi:hypothetical protein